MRGPVAMGKRTKELLRKIKPGQILLIDHKDLDAVAAEELLRARPKAIVNTSPYVSGSYPHRGPLRLIEAKIPLFEGESHIWELIRPGEVILRDGVLEQGGRSLGQIMPWGLAQFEEGLKVAQANLGQELERFVENTLTYAKKETGLILGAYPPPKIQVPMAGRHVVVVVRGRDYRQDLAAITPFIRDVRPVLIGVDGGGDALIEMGFRPDLILGDMDSVSDQALHSGAALVVHAYPDGRAPGKQRLDDQGLNCHIYPSPGTSEDLALLMAYEYGAELITAVGTHSGMVEFLEKGRPGMASTFLVRLKVAERLVDAKGVSQLYQSSPRPAEVLKFGLVGLIPVLILILLAEPLRQWGQLISLWIRLFFRP